MVLIHYSAQKSATRELYRIQFHNNNNNFTLSGGSTRGHTLKLYCPDSRFNVRAHFFAVLLLMFGIHCRLSPHMAAVDDVTSFVRGLDSLSTKFFCTVDSKCHIVFVGYIRVFMFLFVVGGCKCYLSLAVLPA